MLDLYPTTSESEMKSNFVVTYGKEVPLGYPGAGFYLIVRSRHPSACCPKCGNESTTVHQNHLKDKVHGGSFNETPVYFMLDHRRFYCAICDHTFMERIEDIALHAQMTLNAKYAILHATAHRTFKEVANAYGISQQTVRRILLEQIPEYKTQMLSRYHRYLSMDEIFITRNSKGESVYYWVLNDISDPNKIETIRIDMGRLKTDVIKRLQELEHPEFVEAVSSDMWEPYRDAVTEALPHAIFVVDRFHVIQASEKAVEDIRKQQGQNISKEDRKALKKDARLFGENLLTLEDSEIDKLETWFKKLPALEEAYFLSQMLRGGI